jgi:hypothetical protein
MSWNHQVHDNGLVSICVGVAAVNGTQPSVPRLFIHATPIGHCHILVLEKQTAMEYPDGYCCPETLMRDLEVNSDICVFVVLCEPSPGVHVGTLAWNATQRIPARSTTS